MAEMAHPLQVRLPVADVLVVKTVNNVFPHDQIGQIRVWRAAEQTRRDEIGLVDDGVFIATADCLQDLLPQPDQICLQGGQHRGGSEIPSERFVSVQQVARMFLYHNVNRIEQPLQVAFFDERSSEIRHDKVSDEQHAEVWHLDEHRVRRFAALHGNQLDPGSTNRHFGGAVDGDVWLEVCARRPG